MRMHLDGSNFDTQSSGVHYNFFNAPRMNIELSQAEIRNRSWTTFLILVLSLSIVNQISTKEVF
jgi:hypothetical protein